MVPYIHGLGERFKRTCNNLGTQVHFKGTKSIKTLLMVPKDRDSKLEKGGVIYRFKCQHTNCLEECIGESGRTFGDRLKEHLRNSSPIHHHSHSTEHPVNPECFTIIDGKSQVVTMNIKEAMYIHVNDPSLNRNLGKYQLPHIWYKVLQDTPSLQFKQHSFTTPPTWDNPPPNLLYNKWGACATSIGKYCPMWECLPYHPYYCHNIPPLTPKHPTPLHPHFRGAIFGKYTPLFMSFNIFS